MKPTRPLILAVALLAVGLTACSRQEPDATPTDNAVNWTDNASEPMPLPTPTPAPVPTPTADNASRDETVELAPSPDQQMMDDASATGMTARASRDEPSAEQTPAPVDVEQK